MRRLHEGWAWVVVIGNGLVGAWALVAHWRERWRSRALWWATAAAEVAIFVEVALGVGLVTGEDIEPADFHMFYGFVAIITVGIVYSYRSSSKWVRQRIYLVYGGASLFLMGLAIRAMTLR